MPGGPLQPPPRPPPLSPDVLPSGGPAAAQRQGQGCSPREADSGPGGSTYTPLGVWGVAVCNLVRVARVTGAAVKVLTHTTGRHGLPVTAPPLPQRPSPGRCPVLLPCDHATSLVLPSGTTAPADPRGAGLVLRERVRGAWKQAGWPWLRRRAPWKSRWPFGTGVLGPQGPPQGSTPSSPWARGTPAAGSLADVLCLACGPARRPPDYAGSAGGGRHRPHCCRACSRAAPVPRRHHGSVVTDGPEQGRC